jgi:hypothetical protein
MNLENLEEYSNRHSGYDTSFGRDVPLLFQTRHGASGTLEIVIHTKIKAIILSIFPAII